MEGHLAEIVIGAFTSLVAAVAFMGKYIMGKLTDCESDRAKLWEELGDLKSKMVAVTSAALGLSESNDED